MSIDRMARTVGSNRVYVSRAINSCTGGNFYRYLDSYRIKEATRIIQNAGRDISFKALSDEVGAQILKMDTNEDMEGNS